MKIRNLFTGIMAAVSAAAILAVGVSAYDLNTDLGTFWSTSITVPSAEFAELTADSVVTVTFTTDDSLADVEGHSYWVIKPIVNDAGWPLITGISELTPSEDGSSYVVEPGDTSISFTIPADFVEPVQIAGVAFMGHGVTLGEITVSNDAAVEAPAETPAEVPTEAPADTADTETTVPAKGNPDTGVEGVAAAAAAAVLGASAMVISRKRK
ncbi:MAG: NPXTG-anchored protein [Oscillospiraceae bacterium]